MPKIKESIRKNEIDRFTELCNRVYEKQEEPYKVTSKKKIDESKTFILNNWSAVVNRMTLKVCGSCTEPLVSHILSARLSRNPLAWSERGLQKLFILCSRERKIPFTQKRI